MAITENNNHQSSQNHTDSLVKLPQFALDKIPKKMLILGLVFILLLVLAILWLILRFSPPAPSTALPNANASILPSSVLVATDAGKISDFGKTEVFAEFEQKLKSLKQEVNQQDLYENQLTPPLLDMQVSF